MSKKPSTATKPSTKPAAAPALVTVRALVPLYEDRRYEKGETFTLPAARAAALSALVEILPTDH